MKNHQDSNIEKWKQAIGNFTVAADKKGITKKKSREIKAKNEGPHT